MNTTSYEKMKLSLRAKLTGLAMSEPKYYQCVKALEFGEHVHTKLRKDGITPEYDHQLNMLAFALTLHNSLIDPDLVYTCVLLHDAYEDCPEFIDRLNHEFPDEMVYFVRISKITYQKDYEGVYIAIQKSKTAYMNEMANCHVTSVGKGIDRIHNLSTMKGVFGLAKQISYYTEARELFLPMLKTARRKFLRQEMVYESIKSVMNLLVDNIEHFIENIQGNKDDYKACLIKYSQPKVDSEIKTEDK
jgi:(p)ppGpp synthase/HD superfamily hydrolase